jgi:hypothetical protein
VHLAEAGGADRLLVEGGEQLADPRAEFFLDRLLDVVEPDRSDIVLQAIELADERLRKEIGARREDLPELDVRRPELDEPLAKRARLLGDLSVDLTRVGVVGRECDEALLLREIGEAIPCEQADHRRQAWDVARCEEHVRCRGRSHAEAPSGLPRSVRIVHLPGAPRGGNSEMCKRIGER